jgi:hypothetical protein
MSDYFDIGAYDAGAVIDMNNIAIGYVPPSPLSPGGQPICPGPTPAPAQVAQVAQEAQAPSTAPAVPAAE